MTDYSLRHGTRLCADGRRALLLSDRPLMAVRLNDVGLALLRQIDAGCGLFAAAKSVELSTDDARAFLDALVRRGLLLRQPVLSTLLPVVTVIVPVRNRANDLLECVCSLMSLDYPAEAVEIIVVDDASDDETPQAVAAMPVRLIHQVRQAGPAACRNAGAAVARGQILAFTDSDCVVDGAWLSDLVPYVADGSIAAVGGLVEPYSEASAIDRYEEVSSSLYMGRDEADVRPNSAIPFLPTANLLILRDVWERIGGFDESFPIGEDVDLVWRTRDVGCRVRYVPRGRVRHKYRTTLRSFVNRRAFYGGSETFLIRKHRDKPKMLLCSLSKLATLAFVVAGLLSAWHLLLVLALLAPVFDFVHRTTRLWQFGARVPYRWVAGAIARDYAAYYYHICGNFARYYSIPFLLLGLLYLPLLLATLLAMLYPVVHDAVTRRPRLDFATFLVLYWLELLAHQVGMLICCWQCRAFGVLVPRLSLITRASPR